MRKLLTGAAAALSITIATSGVVLAGDGEAGPLARGDATGVERNIQPKQTGPGPFWNHKGGINRVGPKSGSNVPRIRSFGRRVR
jgi:hypothetical protein